MGRIGAEEPKIPLRPAEAERRFSPELPERPGEAEPRRTSEEAKTDPASDEPKTGRDLAGGYAADRNSVGSHLNFIFSSKLSNVMAGVLDAIHSVHGDGGLKGKLPVFTKTALARDAEGMYYGGRRDRTQADRIEMKEDAETPALTFAHETGHWLHHQVFSRWGNKDWTGDFSTLADNENTVQNLQGKMAASQAQGEAIPELTREHLRTAQAMVDLQRTLEATPEIQALRKMGEVGPQGKDVAYLRRSEEIFSRAYAQYIAQKSQQPRLLTDLETRRHSTRARNSQIREYWSDENFRPVAEKFDALLRAKGWLREP